MSLRIPLAIAGLLVFQPAFAGTFTGSGIVVGSGGEIITAAHVVAKCNVIQVQQPLQPLITATVIARDANNDIALLRAAHVLGTPAVIRSTSIRPGEGVEVVGYPLAGLLSSEPSLTTGVVSATAGISDDIRFLQITAPVQPGNSGGPLLDLSGHLVGIVSSKLDFRVAGLTGALPENVNFVIKSEMATLFLNSFGVKYQSAAPNRPLATADIVDRAKHFTVFVVCKSGNEVADAPSRATKSRHTRGERTNWRDQINPSWLKN